MKDEPLGQGARDAYNATLREAATLPFRIIALQRVAFGSKVAEFSIATPLGTIDVDLFTPSGRQPFVQARSACDKFTGQWCRTVALDRAFADRLLDALRARSSEAKRNRQERAAVPVEPSKAPLSSERCFEAALDEDDVS